LCCPACWCAGATELAQLFRNLGTPLSMEKVAEVFMRYDKDESGQIEFGE
jgi:Ca2+-binding EF-hand superfamily protein